MAVSAGVLETTLRANTSQFFERMNAARNVVRDFAKEATTGFSATFDAMNSLFGKGSLLGKSGSLLKMTGAAAGLGVATSLAGQFARSMVEAQRAFAAGEIDAKTYRSQLVDAVPIIGTMKRAIQDVADAWRGAGYEIAKIQKQEEQIAEWMATKSKLASMMAERRSILAGGAGPNAAEEAIRQAIESKTAGMGARTAKQRAMIETTIRENALLKVQVDLAEDRYKTEMAAHAERASQQRSVEDFLSQITISNAMVSKTTEEARSAMERYELATRGATAADMQHLEQLQKLRASLELLATLEEGRKRMREIDAAAFRDAKQLEDARMAERDELEKRRRENLASRAQGIVGSLIDASRTLELPRMLTSGSAEAISFANRFSADKTRRNDTAEIARQALEIARQQFREEQKISANIQKLVPDDASFDPSLSGGF